MILSLFPSKKNYFFYIWVESGGGGGWVKKSNLTFQCPILKKNPRSWITIWRKDVYLGVRAVGQLSGRFLPVNLPTRRQSFWGCRRGPPSSVWVPSYPTGDCPPTKKRGIPLWSSLVVRGFFPDIKVLIPSFVKDTSESQEDITRYGRKETEIVLHTTPHPSPSPSPSPLDFTLVSKLPSHSSGFYSVRDRTHPCVTTRVHCVRHNTRLNPGEL